MEGDIGVSAVVALLASTAGVNARAAAGAGAAPSRAAATGTGACTTQMAPETGTGSSSSSSDPIEPLTGYPFSVVTKAVSNLCDVAGPTWRDLLHDTGRQAPAVM